MTERPILFSGPMVRAILAGTKTQTRRLVKPQPASVWGRGVALPGNPLAVRSDAYHLHARVAGEDRYIYCPYGVPGDRLWVRETIKATPGPARSGEWRITYAADGVGVNLRREQPAAGDKRLRYGMSRQTIPSIHMPRWASRLTLEVTEVRVQRLQDISEEDASAEGAEYECDRCGDSGSIRTYGDGGVLIGEECPACIDRTPRGDFRDLWDSINAKRAPWDSNPWVWCVSFRRLDERKEA